MAEEKNTPDNRKTILVTDLKVGDVVIDSTGSNLEVIVIDTSGKWANVQFRADDGLEIENSYSKDKQLTVVSAPKLRCAECGAPVISDKVNAAGLPICDYCDKNASMAARGNG
jgi:hypothetical protein